MPTSLMLLSPVSATVIYKLLSFIEFVLMKVKRREMPLEVILVYCFMSQCLVFSDRYICKYYLAKDTWSDNIFIFV